MNSTIYQNLQEIVYLKADINYTEFYLQNGKKLVSSITLKHHAEDERLHNFLRINKSYLVNQNYIEKYTTRCNDVIICLLNGYVIKVARRRKTAIKRHLEGFFKD